MTHFYLVSTKSLLAFVSGGVKTFNGENRGGLVAAIAHKAVALVQKNKRKAVAVKVDAAAPRRKGTDQRWSVRSQRHTTCSQRHRLPG